MAVVLEFRSRSAQVLRDQQKVIDGAAKLKDGFKETAKEAGNLERAAQRLNKQLETPQERHNKKLKELSKLLKTGRIDQDQMRKAVEIYNRELREAQSAGRRAFGSAAMSQISSMAMSWLGVGQAISKATQLLKEHVAERDQAALAAQASRRGLGLLQQMAESPEHLQSLLGEARSLFAAGGTQDLGTAGSAIFSLISAGVDEAGRKVFRDLTAQAVITDPAAMARSSRAIQSAMGEGETGGFRDIMSKAFAASAFSPATAEEILQGAAAAGPGARQRGFTDEEVLAATAVLAEPTGSASEAGTKLRALFKNLERGGVDAGSLSEAVGAVDRRRRSGEEFEDIFGGRRDQEAIDAFRLLRMNAETLQRVTANVDTAVTRDVVGQKLALGDSDPQLLAARLAEQAKNRGQVARGAAFGPAANLLAAAQEDLNARMTIEHGFEGTLGNFFRNMAVGAIRTVADDTTALREFRETQTIRDPELLQAIDNFLAQAQEQTEVLRRIEQNQNGKPPVTRVQGRAE